MSFNYFLQSNFTLILGSFFMIVFIFIGPELKKKTKRLFALEVLFCIIEMIAFALERQCAQGTEFSPWRILLSAIGYSIRPFLIYLILLISLSEKNSRKTKLLLAVPAAVNTLFAFSAFFTPIVYSYTKTNQFIRGPLGYAPHAVIVVYLVLMLCFAIYNRNKKKKFEIAIIISIVIVILMSMITEALSSEINIGRTAIILSVIFYYMYFESISFDKKQQEQYEIMQMLSDTYIDVAYINLKNHSYAILRIDETIENNMINENDFKQLVFSITEARVDENDTQKVQDFLNFDTLAERLKTDPLISCEYRDKKYGWCRITLSLADGQRAENAERILCTVQSIDQEKIKEIEMMQVLAKKQKELEHSLFEQTKKQKIVSTLSSIYFTTIMIYLEKETIEPLVLPQFATEHIGQRGGEFRKLLPIFCENFVSEEYREIVAEFMNLDDMKERLSKRKILTCEYYGIKMGWCRIVLVPVIEEGENDITQVVFAVQDVDDEKKKMEAIRYRAEHDELTGLFNRVRLDHIIEPLVGAEVDIAFVIIDIDDFKDVNDTYGHFIGDEILRKVANLIKDNFRSSDVKVRFGGDEFVIILYHTSEAQRSFIEGKIKQINTELMYPTDDLPKTSVSAGIAFSAAGYNEKLYEKADAVLYEEKKKKQRT